MSAYESPVNLSSTNEVVGEGVGGWSAPCPGRFTPGKYALPIVQDSGWAQGRSGRVRNISPSPGLDPRTVQSVTSRYTD
jgi:hypothetical protein